ncbi:response regulator [Paramagnetospirillum magneticum]|uniref:response regulator n=1 Tax=Paramagnetospirillum magneticum TaxID=84159 RepID=UPI0005C25B00|nr:response regulator [Paramagnetospirillum magneticum]
MTQHAQNARILIIDDSVAEATLTKLTLQADRIGCSIEHVTDGYTGIDKLKQAALTDRAYHIVILDVNMPVISGCETLEIIRNTGEIADTYVAILTSLQCKTDCPRDLFLCHAKKADIYLHKETTLDDFEAELIQLKTDYEERRQIAAINSKDI